MRLLLLGATGAVGAQVLQQALDSPDVSLIIAPTRRPLSEHAGKLLNPLIDFTQLESAAIQWPVNAVICTLGTTLKQAGSQAAFAAIDRDLPIAFARLALKHGATSFALNSSVGASARGSFYLRTKYQAEQIISQLGFTSVTLVRPSLIDTRRSQTRPAEQLGIWLCRLINPLLPAQYRSVTPRQIARALLTASLQASPGVQVIESRQLQNV